MYLTLREAAERLQIAPSTIYNNGPKYYGGQKIGGLWRFSEETLGSYIPKAKAPETVNTYTRRFPPKNERR